MEEIGDFHKKSQLIFLPHVIQQTTIMPLSAARATNCHTFYNIAIVGAVGF